MYQAALVEDEPEIRTYIRETMTQAFLSEQIHVSFDAFESGEKFLSMFEQHYHFDMIFLDIEMPGMDGIALCKRIREVAPDTLVVFISNKDELVFQTFEVQPFRFIRKSEYDKVLPSLVDAMITRLRAAVPSVIRIHEHSSGDIFSFDVQKIVYVEAQRKNCRIVTSTGESIVRCKLMDLEEKLSDFSFIKPHRSYYVNCQYVFYIGKNSLQLTTQEELPISRNKLEEVKQQFLNYTTK